MEEDVMLILAMLRSVSVCNVPRMSSSHPLNRSDACIHTLHQLQEALARAAGWHCKAAKQMLQGYRRAVRNLACVTL